MLKPILAAVGALAVAGSAPAATFFSLGAVAGRDPGLASFETLLVDFDRPHHSGVVETDAGALGLHQGTSGIAAAPLGDATRYQAVADGSATFDLRGWFAAMDGSVRSLSVYLGSIDLYNHVDLLDDRLNVIQTISGADLPGNNGDQGAAATNRRLYVNFTGDEHVGGLRFRANGIAFEYDDIAGSTAVFAPSGPTPTALPEAAVPEPATWGMMLVGFGLVGSAARRRRTLRTVAA